MMISKNILAFEFGERVGEWNEAIVRKCPFAAYPGNRWRLEHQWLGRRELTRLGILDRKCNRSSYLPT